MYAIYIAEDDTNRRNPDAWNYGIDYDDLINTIENVLNNNDFGGENGDELVIRIAKEEE